MINKGLKIPPVIAQVVEGFVTIDALNAYQRYSLIKGIVGYVLRVHDFQAMYLMLKEFVNKDHSQQIRKRSVESFNLTVKFKHVVYRLLETNQFNKKIVEEKFVSVGLDKQDAEIYFMLHELELYQSCQDKLQTKTGLFLPPYRIRHKCKRAMRKLEREAYIVKFVKKKFDFIIKSNNLKELDIVHDLSVVAISAFYHEIPFTKSPLHTLNIMKRTIHNIGINIIESYTAQKRARLINIGTGFQSTEQSLSIQDKDGQEYTVDLTDSVNHDDNEVALTLKIGVAKLIKVNHGKRRTVLKLLMLKNNKKFLRWIESTTHRYFDTVEDFYESQKDDAAFLEAIRAYTKMESTAFKAFIKKIKEELV